MRSRHRTRAIALTATAALALTACGSDEPEDPNEALQAAVAGLGDEPFTFDLTLDAEEGAPPELAQGASAIAVTGVSSDGDLELSVRALGTNALTLRQVDDATYVRVDVPSIAAFTGGFTAEDLELAVGDVDPSARPVFEAIVAGQFVSLPAGALDTGEGGTLEDQISGLLEQGLFEGEDVDPEQAAPAIESLVEDLTTRATLVGEYMTITETGEQDDARMLEASLDLREVAERILEAGREAGVEVTDEDEAEVAELAETVAVADVSVVEGLVDVVSVDVEALLNALAMGDGAPQEAPFRLVFDVDDRGGDVDPVVAPDDAVEVPQELLDQLTQQAGQVGAGSILGG